MVAASTASSSPTLSQPDFRGEHQLSARLASCTTTISTAGGDCGEIKPQGLGPQGLGPPYNVMHVTNIGTPCDQAVQIMTLLMAGKGQVHQGADGDQRFVRIDGWKCFGPHTGTAGCEEARREINATGIGRAAGSSPRNGNPPGPSEPGSGGSEDQAILRAFGPLPYPSGMVRLTVRVSRIDPTWAAVYIEPSGTPGSAKLVQPDSGTLHKSNGQWSTIGRGGCNAPGAIAKELGLVCY